MAQTPAVEGAAVSQARSLNKKPRREISGALHMLCQHKEKTKTGCAELRAKLCRIARRVSGMQFTGGFLVLLCILLWNRWYVSRHGESPCATESGSTSQPLAWPHAISKAAIRSFSLLFRMACMTVPLMLGIEWLLKNGVLDFWETALPHAVTELFPTELLSAVAAQFGGLVQSSAVAANLRAEGLIDNSQILLAMLVGSALGNPFRALRRNLPSALAIFPVPIALSIVLGMQLSRFLVTLAGIAGVVWMMLNTP